MAGKVLRQGWTHCQNPRKINHCYYYWHKGHVTMNQETKGIQERYFYFYFYFSGGTKTLLP